MIPEDGGVLTYTNGREGDVPTVPILATARVAIVGEASSTRVADDSVVVGEAETGVIVVNGRKNVTVGDRAGRRRHDRLDGVCRG